MKQGVLGLNYGEKGTFQRPIEHGYLLWIKAIGSSIGKHNWFFETMGSLIGKGNWFFEI